MHIRILIGFAAILFASACAGPQAIGGAENLQVVNASSLPAPTRLDQSTTSRPYLIGAFDKLNIDVFGIEDLQREVQIDASGRLSFPLIGVVEAAGITPDELAVEIKERLRGRFVRDPQVTVNLIETVSQVITVDGQVDKPGLYPVVGKMTLIRAVATAGGVTEYAQMENVIIFREVDGQRMAGIYNLGGIRRGNYADPEVFANDVIVVGDSTRRRMFRDLIQSAPLLTTPLILLFRR